MATVVTVSWMDFNAMREYSKNEAAAGREALQQRLLNMPIEDPLTRYRREAQEMQAQIDKATAEREAAQLASRREAARAVAAQRQHELALAKAQNGNVSEIDGVLLAISEVFSEALNGLIDRVEALEARLDDLEGSNNERQRKARLETEVLDLPAFLAPRFGPNGIRYSQPLMTKPKQ